MPLPSWNTVAGGGVIAYPTEAVFGIGCDPWNETALSGLVRLKRRPLCKGFIVIAGALATALVRLVS